jgi:hypothetical protein
MVGGEDRKWLRDVDPSLKYHALGFDWTGFEPSLTCAVLETGELVDVDLENVDLLISHAKTCVGYFDDDDLHVPCPTHAPVSRFVQCPDCSGESFLPFQECVFEPKCDGEKCDIDFCRREHILYLAFYNTNVKIGMSSTRRIERRLIEQGADAFALVGSFPTRKTAREEEKRLSSRLGIPQAFRQEVVLRGFAKGVDAAGIEEKHSDLASAIEAQFGLEVGAIDWLEDYPIALPLESAPHLKDTAGTHSGELIGIKGKWLIYDSGEVSALNLSDIPSRYVGRSSSR